MQLKVFQADVARLWMAGPLGKKTEQGVAAAAKLAEEAGEVSKEVLALEWWTVEEPPDFEHSRQRLHEEAGDVLFALAKLAHIYNLDLDKVAQDVLERFAKRTGGERGE